MLNNQTIYSCATGHLIKDAYRIPNIRRLYKSLMPFKSSNQQWLDKIYFADTCVALRLITFERNCLLSNIEGV